MGSISAKKPHAVLLPYPAEGHVNPLMQLAKLLHSRGFHITYVNTEFNHKRLIRNKGPDSVKGLVDFRFETIPDGLPPSDRDATQDVWALSDSVRKKCLDPFLELLAKLNSSPDLPPVSCIVSDGVMSFAMKAAEIIGVPEVQFWTASACGYTGNLSFSELIKRGVVPFKDESFMNDGTLDTPIDWIPSMPDIRLRDIPSFIRTTDGNDIMLDFLGTEAQNSLHSPAIIFNTFDALEHRALEALKSRNPHIYSIGPLALLARHMPESEVKSLKSSLWKEDFECLKWLDKQKPQSVVYVNYGSITTMTEENLKEFAWGLANSKQPFLWICRPDVVMGGSASLSEEFVKETKERGFITSWCPQSQVLNHPSVGAFLSHCGWNSTTESLCAGVPVICWPFFGEQPTNTRYLCNVWECGMELSSDVKREDLEAIVREMMGGEKGKAMRKKAQEWKKKAEEATDVGGSSYVNFDRFVKEALHFYE